MCILVAAFIFNSYFLSFSSNKNNFVYDMQKNASDLLDLKFEKLVFILVVENWLLQHRI